MAGLKKTKTGDGLKMTRCDFYVYAICRPDTRICYIGKGTGRRLTDHRRGKGHNSHLNNIFKQAGGMLPVIKLKINLTEAEAFEHEIYYIAKIGREPNGPLVNCTDGGEGTSNISDDNRAKKRAILRGNRYALGYKHTAETRERISAGNKGKTRSKATRMKISIASLGNQKGVNPTAETRAKQSAAHTGRKHTPATLAKMSAAQTGNTNWCGRKHTAETRAKMSAAAVGRTRSAATLSRMREAQQRRRSKEQEDA